MIAGVLAPASAIAQEATFKSGAEFVTFTIRVFNKGTPKTPRLGLTADEFILKIDGKPRPIARIDVLDAGKPTQAYIIGYAPIAADRDGRRHTMEVQVKGIGKIVKRTFRIDR